MKNICCRIFKEQIDLINQLPKKERAIVLYNVINDLFNQFDNQNENQNENAYISVSVLGKSIYNLLFKNITCREFSSNYGGRRENAGAKKKETIISTPVKQSKTNPTLDEILDYARQQNDLAGMGGFKCSPDIAHDFYDYYSGIGWCLPNDAKTPILDWKPFLRKWSRKPQFKTHEPETVNIDDPEHFVI